MDKTLISILIAIIIAGSGGFYLGTLYSQGKESQNFRNLTNLTSEERQQRMQEFGANVGVRGFRQGDGFAAGEILSKDEQGIVVKLQDGGSRIVFVSDSTEITKSVQGSLVDLSVGERIFVNGSQNADGSITAQTIQLRP